MAEDFFTDFFVSVHGWVTIIFIIIVLSLLVGLVQQILPDDEKRDGQGNVIIVNQGPPPEQKHERDRD